MAKRITALERIFAEDDTDGVSGDAWLDDWDGAEDDDKPVAPTDRPEPMPDALPDDPQADDDWQDVAIG